MSTVVELFHRQASKTPGAPALLDGDDTLTYAELAAHANRLSHRLMELGLRRGDLIGLRCGRSADAVIAMLGILGAGAAYVPLEDSLPDERITLMAADAKVRAIVTIAPLTWNLSNVDIVSYARDDAAMLGYPARLPEVGLIGDDLMYVPYTSGSTGQPKGVEVPHRGIPGFFEGEDYGEWSDGARVLYHSAMSWDGHIFEIYPALLSGGTVVIYRGESKDPLAAALAAQRAGVAMLLLPTQAFNAVVSERPETLKGLRCLVIGGEVASRDHLRQALTANPGLRIVNAYGPVECTCLCTVHVITLDDLDLPAVPIGRRAGDREIYLLDPFMVPVGPAETGEVYLGGPSVSHGYLARPAMTAERFVPDPFSGRPGARLYRTGDLARSSGGVYDFAGRADDQIKLRGFRIELGEIDMVLRTHPGVRDAATVASPSPTGLRLVSYVVPDGPHTSHLRDYLRQKLPEAMVPTAILGLKAFPTTHSGKLDRRALPDPADTGEEPAGAAPLGQTEKTLAGLWSQLLQVPTIGREDDFFAVGGQSLLATRLILRIREAFAGVEVSVRDIYDQPLLHELAAVIEKRQLITA